MKLNKNTHKEKKEEEIKIFPSKGLKTFDGNNHYF